MSKFIKKIENTTFVEKTESSFDFWSLTSPALVLKWVVFFNEWTFFFAENLSFGFFLRKVLAEI